MARLVRLLKHNSSDPIWSSVWTNLEVDVFRAFAPMKTGDVKFGLAITEVGNWHSLGLVDCGGFSATSDETAGIRRARTPLLNQWPSIMSMLVKDTRSQDGIDDKDNDKGSKSRSQSMKEQAYNEDKDQEHSSLNDKSNLTDLMKECHQ
ncbi:hypothetical protein Tco_0801324 [Tanacetum coccineum]|uniref:Uncharacterized protein n=1 Tax=Tanacetum coccineum TaxID=301880 RepID=A0ABQ4ZYJ3_9ASTR